MASFRAGWFLTGDRARRDAKGRFFFDGRRADVLKVAGENVSTVEVEQVLAAHPGVLEAAVVGQPDPIRDEVPVGFVVAADAEHPPTTQQLHDWCAEHLTEVEAASRHHLRRRTAPNQRGQDPKVPAARSRSGIADLRPHRSTEKRGERMTILTDELLASFDASITDASKAITLPPQIYTSAEFMEFEHRALFANEWLCVGRASRIPNVG